MAYSQITFNPTGSPQYFVVPPGVTSVHIECWGAQGGKSAPPSNNQGGRGAYTSGDFLVSPGDTLIVIVGEKGSNGIGGGSNMAGGGGGGSFVIKQNGNVPFIIAAGGGGGSYQANAEGEPGQADANAGGGGYAPASAGQGGYSDNSGGGGYGGGGSGWFSNGVGNNWCTPAIMQGGPGGLSFATDPSGDGGFGGGGAGYNGGGGGGGFTGGGGGSYVIGGGGGGSYNTGTNQVNTSDVKPGSGEVVIDAGCIPMIGSSALSDVCIGENITLNVTSTQGGNITWSNGASNGVPFQTLFTGVNSFTATSDVPSDCPLIVTVLVNDLPAVQALADTAEFCYGTTQVTLTGAGADVYSWDNGVTDGIAFDAPVGYNVYTVNGTNLSTGCENTDSVLILASYPTPAYAIDHEQWGVDGVIDLTVTNVKTPCIYDWDNDGTGDWDDPEDLVALTAGTYNVVIEDALGCQSAGSATVYNYTNVDEEEVIYSVYPNPTQDILTIAHPGSFTYIITDLNGRQIFNGIANNVISLDVLNLEPGQYFIGLYSGADKAVASFIKK